MSMTNRVLYRCGLHTVIPLVTGVSLGLFAGCGEESTTPDQSPTSIDAGKTDKAERSADSSPDGSDSQEQSVLQAAVIEGPADSSLDGSDSQEKSVVQAEVTELIEMLHAKKEVPPNVIPSPSGMMRGHRIDEETEKLISVDLQFTPATDADMAKIVNVESIETLNLRGTQITDVGLSHFKVLRKLRFVDLSDTAVTEDGIKELEKALPGCRVRSSASTTRRPTN